MTKYAYVSPRAWRAEHDESEADADHSAWPSAVSKAAKQSKSLPKKHRDTSSARLMQRMWALSSLMHANGVAVRER